MATTNIQLNVGGRTFTKPKAYSSVIDRDFEVNHSQDADDYMTIYTSSSGLGVTSLQSLKCFCLYNKSNVGVEIQIQNQDWKNDSSIDVDNSVDVSGAGASNDRFHTFILAAGDFFYSSTGKFIDYYKGTESAANAAALNNRVPDDNAGTPKLYIDSTANVDAAGIVGSTTETTIKVEPWTSAANNSTNLFYVGDLIRVDDEIMEVTAVGDKSSLANNTLTVIRGVSGSAAASDAADGDPINFPIFNMYENFDKYSVAQTNMDGRFKCTNFFGGFGRRAVLETQGIVGGSVAIKFYEKAYQDWGMTGITPSTNSGLSTSTTYHFKIDLDGATSVYSVSFTTDASNVNFGGKNGIISKIQNIFDSQFYVEGSCLYERRATIGIVNGDIRITSESRLSTSAVAITAGSAGSANTTNLFDGTNPIARIPASPKTAVASRLPEDTIFSKSARTEKPNTRAFMYDDGNGNFLGAGSGTIDYTTGMVDFKSYPNAEFVVSANYHSAHSGGTNNTTDAVNQIEKIKARSCNSKINGVVQLIAYGE